jgi:hypothetical protein
MNDLHRNRREVDDILDDPDFAGIQKRARIDSYYTFDDKENCSWQSNTWNALGMEGMELDDDLVDLEVMAAATSTVKDEDEKKESE